MFVGYSNIHENDVYQLMDIVTKKSMFSRDVIWLNMTYSQHMGISQVDFISSEVEDEDVEEEEVYKLKGEVHVGPPPTMTEDDHSEKLIYAPETTSNIVAPYPTSTRQFTKENV
jgi:hypothetical protein